MLLEYIIYGLATFSVAMQPNWETFARFEVPRVVLMKFQIFLDLMSIWSIGTQVWISENGKANSSKIFLTFCQLRKSHVPEDTNLENLFFSIVVIRNGVSLNYYLIIILLYFHLTARWYKKLKRGWVASIWARTSNTSSENHEAFCFATVEAWSPKRSAYENRCHIAVSPWAYPAGEIWWPHSDLLTAGHTCGNKHN
jgi:hypothetical protein